MEQNPIDIIRSFAEDHLESSLDNLISFDLKKLMKNEVYGCSNRKFDADDTTIMRAIYCVVFGSVWPNLTMDNSGNEKMRGDTMNSSATFFSYPWNDRFTPSWNPPAFLRKKIAEFQTTFHTVGNMTVLPDKRAELKDSVNSILNRDKEYYSELKYYYKRAMIRKENMK